MLGNRIKQARLDLGMSQQQLGGNELSRSFICRIEQGKANPSLATLKLLASRLRRPLEFFTATDESGDTLLKTVRFLIRSARRSLTKQEWDKALHAAQHAVHLSQSTNNLEMESKAYLTLLSVYERLGRYWEAIDIGESLIERFRGKNQLLVMAEAYERLGHVFLFKGDLTTAKRYFLRILQISFGRKSLMEFEAHAHVSLGETYYRLGEFSEAIDSYCAALELCTRGVSQEFAGTARLGLAWVLYHKGETASALRLTREAQKVFRMLKHPTALSDVRYYLAVMESGSKPRTETIEELLQCLQEYERQGQVRKEAGVLDEMANQSLLCHNVEQAQEFCQKALALLDRLDDGFLRGRLYRTYARIQNALGHTQRMRDLALLSLELLRRQQAQREVLLTEELIGTVDLDRQSVTHLG